MNKYFVILSVLAVATVILQPAASINCYKCNTETDKACGNADDLEDKHSTACPDEVKWCLKTTGETDGDEHIIRSCAPAGDQSQFKDECLEETQEGVTVEVCACDSDNCNSSMSIMASSLTIVACVAAVVKSFYHH